MVAGEVSWQQLCAVVESETAKAYIEVGHARREHNHDQALWARGRLDGLRTVLKIIDPAADEALRQAH